MVLIMTGQTVGSTVTTNSVCSENPNRSNPSGANAIPGIGRSTSMLASPNFRAVYDGLDDTWNARARQLNEMLAAQNLPVRVANLSSIWSVHYTEPSRYNWMFQYYLRAEQLALSWVGTGRLIFSLNYTDADFAEVMNRFVAAAQNMKQDGWWWRDAGLTNKAIRRQILKEMVTRRSR